MKQALSAYFEKRSFWKPEQVPHSENISELPAVVIPACNEYPLVFETFASLEASAAYSGSQNLVVICVVNNTAGCTESVRQNNLNLLSDSKCSKYKYPHLIIKLLDRSSEGNELPPKNGVGYARKWGMDYALAAGASVIACLDADTLVSENYVSELYRFAESAKRYSFALCRFEHQKAVSEELQQAINLYESSMLEHSRKLKETGTPFWPVALGPTTVCKADFYAVCGGMNCRLAGEDFYYLQSLIKCSLQQNISFTYLDSIVYPAARFSDRVLFGTGPALEKLVDAEKKNDIQLKNDVLSCFKFETYQVIGNFIRNKATDNKALKEFLEREKFFEVWKKIKATYRKSPEREEIAFHIWFDGLKIIRAVHALESDE